MAYPCAPLLCCKQLDCLISGRVHANNNKVRRRTEMTTVRSILSRLPGIAFATLAITGETIAICRGEPSYYRVETSKTAEELNTMYGVSPTQARAMLAGTIRGWHTQLADPGQQDADGNLIFRPDGDRPGKP
jgi:hypothetical protein